MFNKSASVTVMEVLKLEDLPSLRAKRASGTCGDFIEPNENSFGWVTPDSYVLCHYNSIVPEQLSIEHLDKPFLGVVEERAKSMGVSYLWITIFTGSKLMRWYKRNGFVKISSYCLNFKINTMIKRLN